MSKVILNHNKAKRSFTCSGFAIKELWTFTILLRVPKDGCKVTRFQTTFALFAIRKNCIYKSFSLRIEQAIKALVLFAFAGP